MENLKDILVLYHGNCTDGFGAAYAAWKKFGDTASYLPQDRTAPFDESMLIHKDVFVLDYSFSKEEMLSHQRVARTYTVIDHHISAQEAVQSLTSYVFKLERSGAYLAWEYFHPGTKVPELIQYISDSDIWEHKLPDWEPIQAYIYREVEHRFSFEHFEKLYQELETEEGMAFAKKVGTLFQESRAALVKTYITQAERVVFEGHEVYAVNAPREIRSELGHQLATLSSTFAMLFTYEMGRWKCSMRSVKGFDVSVIATKYGGGGHTTAAAFSVPTDFPLPFAKRIVQ